MIEKIQQLLAESGFEDFLLFACGEEHGGVTGGAGSQVRLFETIVGAMEGNPLTMKLLYSAVMSFIEERKHLQDCPECEGVVVH